MRHPEIDQANRPVVAEKDVSGLEIVVDDLPAVEVLDGLADAAHDAQSLTFGQPASFADAGGERRPRDVLGDDVAAVLSWRERDESQDVRVVELAPDLGLALEHGPAAETARELRQRNLHGHHLALVLEVLRLEHGRHAAAADLLEEQEAAFECLAGSGFRGERHGLQRAHGERGAGRCYGLLAIRALRWC